MFDRLIESDSVTVAKPRRTYFMVSSIAVGISFITAVVASLCAQNIDLGVGEFDSAMLVTPIIAEAPESLPLSPHRDRAETSGSGVPARQSNMLRPDENPTIAPMDISTRPNTEPSRPNGYFLLINGSESNDFGIRGANNIAGTGEPRGTGSRAATSESVAKRDLETEPPPPGIAAVKPPPMRSEGVINGKAKYLPPPPYPPAARAVGAEGNVDVQVTIDELGNVISSRAVSGNFLLRQAAESAARKAKFSPTLLSHVPVKVTGVIVYKFSRN